MSGSALPGMFPPGGAPPGGAGGEGPPSGGTWLFGPEPRWLRGPKKRSDAVAEALTHDVRETRDYQVPFARVLDEGDAISEVAVGVSPSGGLTATAAKVDSTVARVRLVGGAAGTTYTVTVSVTTTGGQVLVHELEVTGA